MKKFDFPLDLTKSYKKEGKWIIEGWAALTGPDRNYPIVELTAEALKGAEKDLL